MRCIHIRASHIRVFRIWWDHIWCDCIRWGRFWRLGLFVNDVLSIGNASIGPAKLAADDITRLFQLLDGIAYGLHALLADFCKSPCTVIPVLRKRKEHGQQPLGFQ